MFPFAEGNVVMADFAMLETMGIGKLFNYHFAFNKFWKKFPLGPFELEETIADVVLECWLKNQSSGTAFDKGQFRRYVYLTLRHAIFDILSSRGHTYQASQLMVQSSRNSEESYSLFQVVAPDQSPFTEDSCDFETEFFSVLHEMVDDSFELRRDRELGHRSVDALKYFHVDGLSYEEIAHKLGLSSRQAAHRLRRDSVDRVLRLVKENADKIYSRFGYVKGDFILGCLVH